MWYIIHYITRSQISILKYICCLYIKLMTGWFQHVPYQVKIPDGPNIFLFNGQAYHIWVFKVVTFIVKVNPGNPLTYPTEQIL